MEKFKKLLMVGGGHAHIFLIKQFALKPIPGVDLLLVSDCNYQYYSGMTTGYVEGIYGLDENSFDLKKMCKHSGVEFIKGKITGIAIREASYLYDNLLRFVRNERLLEYKPQKTIWRLSF